jgi:hypothetical protein
MRRIKVSGRDAVYHCMSRAVNRERLFDDRAKEQMRRMLWQVADFSGVEVLSYCVMSNHVHVLLRVPEREEAEAGIDDRELLRRFSVLYPKPTEYQTLAREVLERVLQEGGEEGERARRRLLERMHDVSQYMKSVKQRYTIWYNRHYGRVGTLWSERFKSVLVEGEVAALQIVSGYIDLNPVRAGVVSDPKDYRWSSYGEAMGGSERARRGLMAVLGGPEHARLESKGPLRGNRRAQRSSGWARAHRGSGWAKAHREYRVYLYCKGSGLGSGGEERARSEQNPTSGETERAQSERSPACGGSEGAHCEGSPARGVAEALRCRVRYFTDGAVIGSSEFVQAALQSYPGALGGKRRRAPRRMPGSDWSGLRVAREGRTPAL